jgi:ankyrin repeat protein
MLILHGANVDARSFKGLTPLHLADNPIFVEYLIKKGANVNEKGYKGNTALHLAALYGNLDVAKILISNGAIINALNDQQATALDLAELKEHKEMIEYLRSTADGLNKDLVNDLLKIPTQKLNNIIDNIPTRETKIKSDRRISIGELKMQQFKSSSSNEPGIINEQKKSIKTGKEYLFDVTVEINENEKKLYERAKIFVHNKSDNLAIVELPIFAVTIITILNLPERYWPSNIDTYMPISGQINNTNYFYKATPQVWKEILKKNAYFKENWSDYKI